VRQRATAAAGIPATRAATGSRRSAGRGASGDAAGGAGISRTDDATARPVRDAAARGAIIAVRRSRRSAECPCDAGGRRRQV
jgi:hypothetical protein